MWAKREGDSKRQGNSLPSPKRNGEVPEARSSITMLHSVSEKRWRFVIHPFCPCFSAVSRIKLRCTWAEPPVSQFSTARFPMYSLIFSCGALNEYFSSISARDSAARRSILLRRTYGGASDAHAHAWNSSSRGCSLFAGGNVPWYTVHCRVTTVCRRQPHEGHSDVMPVQRLAYLLNWPDAAPSMWMGALL